MSKKQVVVAVRLTEQDGQRLKQLSELREWSQSYTSSKLIREGLDRYERQESRDRESVAAGSDVLPILERKQASAHGSSHS